jgi:hypothetical protein
MEREPTSSFDTKRFVRARAWRAPIDLRELSGNSRLRERGAHSRRQLASEVPERVQQRGLNAPWRGRIISVSWSIARGPREFEALEGFDMDVGWAYYLERGEEERTVSVIVSGGRLRSNQLPWDARRSIETRGRAAVETVLGESEPPRYLMVTPLGVERRERS